MDLNEIRVRIDAVDDQLLQLFLEFEDMLPPRHDMTENWK